ncbi:transcriptional regulator [Alteribacter lacisalsi]|uniref:HTH-type transcriptional regulatory protein TyrR n=2 Tax=Alteribacter lacisalsi TaxID=2045244 RepID=A0A2W0H8W1_9BACI|nr:transcriptional regulator [Alteribacter lacisalsi]
MMEASEIFQSVPFKKILNVINDGLFFADGTGMTLWVNEASERILNLPSTELIGKDVFNLEEKGIMSPSITRMVIESRNNISTIQTLPDQKRYLVTGHLLSFGEDELVVVHSRDITKAITASNKLEDAEKLLATYSQEIRQMKQRKPLKERRFIGNGPVFRELSELIQRVANVNTTIFITGETGVGKNAVAERIHRLSDRHDKPFTHINCGAIPENLIESELFGYMKGAFTGANVKGKEGMVQMTEGGTLFLDEISELPLHLQPKLLQLLQNKMYLPVGATKMKTADVRIIAAANKDLLEMTRKGEFREDLYYRLNIIPVHVPPLRERKDDIFPILQMNVDYFNQIHNQTKTLSSSLIDTLTSYEWPGNIRELENLIERLVITSSESRITAEDLPGSFLPDEFTDSGNYMRDNEGLPNTMERIEKEIIAGAMKKHKTTRQAAEALGVSQSSIMRRIKKYKLNDHGA